MQPIVRAVDTETFPFGEQADGSIKIIPKMICTTIAEIYEGDVAADLISDGDGIMGDMWESMLTGEDMLLFHNAAYDLGVCIVTFPELEELVWDKIERCQIVDTKIREKLLNLSTHGNLESLTLPDGSKEPLAYSLGDLILKYHGKDRSAEKEPGSVRTQYHLYSGWRSSQYPDEARRYALEDAADTLRVYLAQEALIQTEDRRASVGSQHFQVAADLALFLTTAQGMRLDSEMFVKIENELAETLSDQNMRPLVDAGILRPGKPAMPHSRQINKAIEILGHSNWDRVTETERQRLTQEHEIKWKAATASSIDTTALKGHIEALWKKVGKEPKLTATGQISADSEVIDDLVLHDTPRPPHTVSPLECYQTRQEVGKLVSTELPRMRWNGNVAERIYFPFNALLSSGRTSSFASKHYPSANGQNLDPRARLAYLPEDGCWLASIDYSTLELCSVGQVCYNLFGQSTHRDLINQGIDLHAYLAAALARALDSDFEGHPDGMENYKLFKALKTGDPKKFKFWRGFAKPVGLGYPGGLGALTFISLAKKTYRVDIISAACSMDESLLPRWEHSTVKWYAEQFGITEDNWTWTPLLKGIALAVLLKEIWFETFPQMRDYFEWVKAQEDFECLETEQDEDGDKPKKATLCYTTPLGMYRTGCNFAAAANGMAMQSPSAEGAKIAVLELVKAIRIGCLKGLAALHVFVHDEVIVSVPADPDVAQEVVETIQQIMQDAMSLIMPDVRISTSASLMLRWDKRAEPVYNEAGRLVPWTPPESSS